ncbi:hypothetical protein TrRE_jg5930 [Triparma retinervis]|uniref:Uncharacterized protein n=1 Tax=Triparma retinervis TaxID=2557542 RepID=A0A9W7AQ32_9STRA|nr:hypothetical protein TrRE_jg5930 [Triparma retinervis]
MLFNKVVIAAMLVSAGAFVPSHTFVARKSIPLFSEVEEATPAPPAPSPPSSSSSSGGALVPISEESVQFTAGIIGGVAGFALAGPVGATIGAGFANFASKTEEDVGDIVKNLSKTSLEVYNYMVKLDNKYEVLKKSQEALQASYDNIKDSETVDPETVSKVEKALADTTSKITEINDEYDIVGAGLQALGIVGDITEKAVIKTVELNKEYKLTDKGIEAVQRLIDKVKESA